MTQCTVHEDDRQACRTQIRADRATGCQNSLIGHQGNRWRQRLRHIADQSGRAGLVYLGDYGLSPYVGYSTSFEPTPGSDFNGSPFKPTKCEQYEAGIKYQPNWFDGLITVAAYDLTQQNVTTADPNPAHLGFSVQTGEIRLRGLEIEGVANLTEALDLRASYGRMDGKVTKSNDYRGNVLARIPQNIANVWLDYHVRQGPLNGLSLGGGVRFVDDLYGDAANRMLLPSATLVDAALQYDFGAANVALKGLKMSANAYNLLDKTYVGQCASAGFCQYGARRSAMAKLGNRW